MKVSIWATCIIHLTSSLLGIPHCNCWPFPSEIIKCLAAFMNFCYLVQCNAITSDTLCEIENTLAQFHHHHKIFIQTGIHTDISMPCQHAHGPCLGLKSSIFNSAGGYSSLGSDSPPPSPHAHSLNYLHRARLSMHTGNTLCTYLTAMPPRTPPLLFIWSGPPKFPSLLQWRSYQWMSTILLAVS